MDSRLYLSQFEDPAYKKYNLIAIDEHGHGGTTGQTDFTFWDTAKDALDLLTALGVDQFFVLGTSQGGFIALRMALLDPSRLLGMILLGTNAASESPENIAKFTSGRNVWCQSSLPSDSAMLVKSSSFGGPQVVGERTYAKICEMWKARYAGLAGYDPAFKCLRDRDSIVERLHSIQVPALIMHGTNDMVYSVDSAKEWSKLLPHVWRFEVVEGGHHYLSFVSPGLDRCRDLVPQFIDAQHATGYK